jgi:hypothetical protein
VNEQTGRPSLSSRPHGTTLGPFELDDDETEPGAMITRPGEPDRRVIGLLDAKPA